MTNKIIKEKSQKRKDSVSKSRYFMFLLYPDSVPEDYMSKLTNLGQPMAISPLHDMDKAVDEETGKVIVDEETGEIRYKKPHWHAIYIANNNVTKDSVRKKIQRTLGKKAVAEVQICDNVGNYYKYLTHESKDAIEKKKHRYDRADIRLINNFDIDRYTDLSKDAKDDALMTLCDIIRREEISDVFQLMDYIEENEIPGMTKRLAFSAIKSSTSMIRLFLDGAYQRRKAKDESQMNK